MTFVPNYSILNGGYYTLNQEQNCLNNKKSVELKIDENEKKNKGIFTESGSKIKLRLARFEYDPYRPPQSPFETQNPGSFVFIIRNDLVCYKEKENGLIYL